MPKILFIDHTAAIGGAELVLLEMATACRDDCTVLLFDDGPFRERLRERGVPVEIVPGQGLHDTRREDTVPRIGSVCHALRLAARIVPIVRRHECVYAHSQKGFVVGALAGVLARRPVVWDLNDLMIPEHFSAININVGVFLANHVARRVIANSKASALALARHGAVADKIHVLYNGIDDAPFNTIGDAEIAAARHEFGLEGATVVGVFGRLAEWKGQHVALDALRLLPGVHLLIVGDALFGEDRYAASLREQARRIGVAGRVHFAGFRRDIPLLMRAVDIVAHTSIAPEPFGRVIVEGMLARRPVIATRGGGVDEIVEPGETGILVTPGSVAELAEAIGGLAAGPDVRRRLAEAGRDAAVRRFSQTAMLNGMRAHIDGVLAA